MYLFVILLLQLSLALLGYFGICGKAETMPHLSSASLLSSCWEMCIKTWMGMREKMRARQRRRENESPKPDYHFEIIKLANLWDRVHVWCLGVLYGLCVCVFGTWCGAYAAETISSLNITFWFLLVFVRCFRDLFFGKCAEEVRLTMRTRHAKQAIVIVNTAKLMTAERRFAAKANEPSEYFICQKYWFYYCLTAIIVNEAKTKQMNRIKFLFGLFSIHAPRIVTTTKCYENISYAFWMSTLFSTEWGSGKRSTCIVVFLSSFVAWHTIFWHLILFGWW